MRVGASRLNQLFLSTMFYVCSMNTQVFAEEKQQLESATLESNHQQEVTQKLSQGLKLYYENKKEASLLLFARTLKEDTLGYEAKALAYWYLFLCQRDLRIHDKGAESLASFLALSNEIIDNYESIKNIEPAHAEMMNQFIDTFQLRERQLIGQVMLDALWAEKDIHYGRTQESAVNIKNQHAQKLFIALIKPCGTDDTDNETADIRFEDSLKTQSPQIIEHAKVYCPNSPKPYDFYFKK